MQLIKSAMVLIATTVFLSGCATWSSSNLELKNDSAGSAQMASHAPVKKAEDVLITEKDIGDRKYKVLGDIEVTVNKTTIFHDDPTREMVRKKLQEEGAKIGADAVILVRYGTVGVSLMSWGSLDGKGRAVVFTN